MAMASMAGVARFEREQCRAARLPLFVWMRKLCKMLHRTPEASRLIVGADFVAKLERAASTPRRQLDARDGVERRCAREVGWRRWRRGHWGGVLASQSSDFAARP